MHKDYPQIQSAGYYLDLESSLSIPRFFNKLCCEHFVEPYFTGWGYSQNIPNRTYPTAQANGKTTSPVCTEYSMPSRTNAGQGAIYCSISTATSPIAAPIDGESPISPPAEAAKSCADYKRWNNLPAFKARPNRYNGKSIFSKNSCPPAAFATAGSNRSGRLSPL